jgi:hypothetical protein
MERSSACWILLKVGADFWVFVPISGEFYEFLAEILANFSA